MKLEKILKVICVIFLAIFILSAILILTNALNMWLPGMVSFVIAVASFVAMKVVGKKTGK